MGTILVLGGTTEGRRVVEALDRAGKRYYYSTRDGKQQIDSPLAVTISGGMTSGEIVRFCRENEVGLIVDAGHPFAVNLHREAVAGAQGAGVALIRYERIFPVLPADAIVCASYDEACRKMEADGIDRPLILSGVQTISRLRSYLDRHKEARVRVLDRDESRQMAVGQGVELSRLIYYSANDENADNLEHLIYQHKADAVLTKESGESGGFAAKATAAARAGVRLVVVRRPKLPDGYSATVEGPAGLRREVERLLPGFYELRSGITTGTCATAAATAAMMSMLTGKTLSKTAVRLPDGERIAVAVESSCRLPDGRGRGVVVKDAGDDPDVTDGARIVATVELSDSKGDVTFAGGYGIGRVTLSGTGLEIGQPAINLTPRTMITAALRTIEPEKAIRVTIDIDNGKELALRTFNPRIGIVGGLSVIGTSGIVIPLSHEAYVDALRREMQVAVEAGRGEVVINSGARSERALQRLFPSLSPYAFVHYGNAVGEALAIANELSVSRLTIGMMIGKAVKVAGGEMDTHSHRTTMDRELLVGIAADAGCNDATISHIRRINMAKELWAIPDAKDVERMMTAIARRACDECAKIYSSGILRVVLITDDGETPYSIEKCLD